MQKLLNRLFNQDTLTYEEAWSALRDIGKGVYKPEQIVSFLTVYNMRRITPEELSGFKDAMLDLCIKIDLSEFEPIDIVGTGGDGKDTFNISTAAAIVVAGAGYKVAKHGNYGVSSKCGSSNVLEYLGVSFTNNESALKRSLDEAGFCILHAPLFHPAMKNVAPIRKELQVRTFFNILGPLINPSQPEMQVIGVYNLELVRLFDYLYQRSGKKYTIIHGLDVYDEISLTSSAKVISNKKQRLLDPADFGFEKITQKELWGGTSIEEAARIFVNVIKGKGTTAQTNVVIANAAIAIETIDPSLNLEAAVELAKASILSGNAFAKLKKIISKQLTYA
jgi:anthranilate phosphoribosyltransferase